jgi:hypothetical protein
MGIGAIGSLAIFVLAMIALQSIGCNLTLLLAS